MLAKLLPNGNKLIPIPVLGPGGVHATVAQEITPDDPDFDKWPTLDALHLKPRDLGVPPQDVH